MDTPVKIIVATMILMIVAAILLSMFTGQTEPLSNFVDTEREGAKCDVGRARYGAACNCNKGDGTGYRGETDEAGSIKQKYVEEMNCDWGGGRDYSCVDACS
jgi:hypothetical protein